MEALELGDAHAERKAQPRWAKGVGRAATRSPGVGCRASLGIMVICYWQSEQPVARLYLGLLV
jgi:hypothetical protein